MKFVLLFCLLWGSLCAQVGVAFPSLQGTALDEKHIAVPAKNGKYSVVGIAFHRDAEDALKKWLNPLYDVFIKTENKNSQEFDMADIYDVNFVFVPMISGFRRVADEFKKKTDKQFWAYIVDIEKTNVSALQGTLHISDNKVPYFFVIDPQGKVVAEQHGNYSVQKLDKLEDAIE